MQLLRAVNHLHSRNIYHRDIKFDNILIDSEGNVKLIDFGFSTLVKTGKLKLFCGTPSYMCPEIVKKREYRGYAADIWAVGVVIFAISAGRFPFKSPIERELYRKIIKGLFEYPAHVSPPTRLVIDMMLNLEGAHRPTAEALLSERFFMFDHASSTQNSQVSSRLNASPCTVDYQPMKR